MRALISCLLFIIVTFGYAEEHKEFYGIKIGTQVAAIENFKVLETRTIKDLDRPFDLIKGKILDEEKNFYLAIIDGNIEGIEFIKYFNGPVDVNAKLAEMEKKWGPRIKERDLIIEDVTSIYEFPDIDGEGKYVFNIDYSNYDWVMTETYFDSKAIPVNEYLRDYIKSLDQDELAEIRMRVEIKRKAEAGDAQAQTNLGELYFNKYYYGDDDDDLKKAWDWIEKAANQGFSKAQMLLGVMHFKGYDGHQNYEEAFKWLRKAADQGEKKAKEALEHQCKQGQPLACD